MAVWKPLPIGIDNFKKLIQENYFYVDKTLLIKELLDMKGEVNLFTRPRRFGKTLNMSMLQNFFENSGQSPAPLFQGLKIMDTGDKYLSHMGKYPVISICLKSLKQSTYKNAFYCLKEEIAREFKRHDQILNLIEYPADREKYLRFAQMQANDEEYLTSLKFLSQCLYDSFKIPCIILIDEYDVPLENAWFSGFYKEMSNVIRSIFESVLKTNDSLSFAVVTGCLRISKESIFTGLNNLKIISVTNDSYGEFWGFTQNEVESLMDFYGLSKNMPLIRDWYDGYLFGDSHVYNPWSVINYIDSCHKNPNTLPKPYWSNTSSNHIVRSLIEQSDFSVKQEIETLIQGASIIKPVHEDITYEDIYASKDHLWNFLFFTGYLTKVQEKQTDEDIYMEMKIPNREVRYIYKTSVLHWFEEQTGKKDLSALYESILCGDTQNIAHILSENLMETISFYDYQENYYHGFLTGLLINMKNYIVQSNRESGTGRPDIVVKSPSIRGEGIIFEIKVAKRYQDLEQKCHEALEQIREKNDASALLQEGYSRIIKYGIAFYRKECMVCKENI